MLRGVNIVVPSVSIKLDSKLLSCTLEDGNNRDTTAIGGFIKSAIIGDLMFCEFDFFRSVVDPSVSSDQLSPSREWRRVHAYLL